MHNLKSANFIHDDLTATSMLSNYNLSHRDVLLCSPVDTSRHYDAIEVFGTEPDLVRFLVDHELYDIAEIIDFDPNFKADPLTAAA